MKKANSSSNNDQLKIDFPSIPQSQEKKPAKVISMANHSNKAFVAYIIKNTKSF